MPQVLVHLLNICCSNEHNFYTSYILSIVSIVYNDVPWIQLLFFLAISFLPLSLSLPPSMKRKGHERRRDKMWSMSCLKPRLLRNNVKHETRKTWTIKTLHQWAEVELNLWDGLAVTRCRNQPEVGCKKLSLETASGIRRNPLQELLDLCKSCHPEGNQEQIDKIVSKTRRSHC